MKIPALLKAKNGNVISLLKKEEVHQIGADAIRMYDEDMADPRYARKKKNWEKGQKLVMQEIETKDTPFKNAANVKYPLLTTASIQFNSRAYPEIVKGHSVVKPKIIGEFPQPNEEQMSKIQRAEKVCEFINWQLFNEITEWEEGTDRLMLQLPLYGSMFRCTYYSAEKKRIVSELYTPEEIVLPYKAPSLMDSPRLTKAFTLYPRQVRERIASGRYAEFDEFEDEDNEKPEDFIEQYTWLDLDDDKIKEPYIVTVHKDTSKCLRISPNYRLEDVKSEVENGPIVRIKALKYFVKYVFIPASDGSIYDLGFFDLLYPINEVINSTTNRLLDAGTLANSQTGIISASLGLRKKGPLKLKQGEFITVPATGQDIKNQIYHIPWNQPSPVLFQLLDFMVNAGRDIANLKEVLEGTQEMEQTATTTMALIEQGLKVFSAIFKRIHRSLSEELQIIRFWNHMMRAPQYSKVVDSSKFPVSQEDFANDELDFIPVSDPSVVTDSQKMAKVQFMMQFMNDPYINQMELRKEIWEGANMDGFERLRADTDPMMKQLQEQLQKAQQIIQQLQEANKDLEDTTKFDQQMALLEEERKATLDEASAVNKEVDAIKKLAEAEATAKEAQISIEKVKQEVEASGQGRVGNMAGAPSN